MPESADDLRQELWEIGQRRLDLARAKEKLARDTFGSVRRARGKVSMVEMAKLLSLDRTTLYQTYVDG